MNSKLLNKLSKDERFLIGAWINDNIGYNSDRDMFRLECKDIYNALMKLLRRLEKYE